MKLKVVTLTGADDSVDPQWMVDLSSEFSFVEWGILVSSSQQGGPRFPSLEWLAKLWNAVEGKAGVAISIHVCGRWVREICGGNWTPLFTNLGPFVGLAQRIQLNFHAYEHLLTPAFIPAALKRQATQRWQVIFQCDGVNDHLVSNAYDDGLNAVPLYDKSGGAGVVPEKWPVAMRGIYSGYAGGIGPTNVVEELLVITEAAGGEEFWIDMETKLRSDTGHGDRDFFDMKKCRRVLEECAPLVTDC